MSSKKNRDESKDAQFASVEDAKAQVAEYFGFALGVPIPITLPDGTVEEFVVPYPGMLGAEQRKRWNRLQFEIKQCDRYPDKVVPDHKLTHKVVENAGTENERVEETESFIPGYTERGALILPHQKTLPDGTVELMEPDYESRVAIAFWGEDGYERFLSGGGDPYMINLIQSKMQREFEERQAADPKSGSGAGSVAEVPEAD
ncbi:hypothetical protein [Mycobacterium sp. SMC-4]|uniref:hypothetical protein n=1 Tax=Mycobacterium sp. SMC-4 TaxID=2857059 RepID=UPI0021B45E0E|nr:hypothetical protein [Mycobacterium sp. SMC-4]UXA19553.1 hypothetical protein KXD98_08125 [Mycobacterium sp. SMC-4]